MINSAPTPFYTDYIIRYRWLAIVLASIVMLAISSGAPLIKVTSEYRSMFDDNNPQLAKLDEFENIYGKSDNVLIAIAPNNGNTFSREVLSAIEELTEESWLVPHSIRVDSLTNYTYSSAIEDELIVEPLVINASSLADSELERIRNIALNEREITGRLVAGDGTVSGIVVTFALPEEEIDAAIIEISDFVSAMVKKAHTLNPEIDYYVTGSVMLYRTFELATTDDIKKLAPLVLLVITIIAIILTRSIWGTVALLITVIFCTNTVIGFAGWIGIIFNPANAGVPVIVLTIAVANSVHIVDNFLEVMRYEGKSRNDAITASLRSNLWPIFLTSVTTIIGFLSLNSSDAPPFRVMGNLVAFGMLWTFIYSVVMLPALLSILPIKVKPQEKKKKLFFESFGNFVVLKKRILLFVSTTLSVIIVSGIFLLELTDNWWSFFDDRYQFSVDTRFVSENLTGIGSLEYSLKSGEENGITNPTYLQRVEDFANWFRVQPEVLHVQAFTDIMKRLNMNMNADDPSFRRIPENQELAAQYLLLYEFSLPPGQDLNNRIDIGKSSTRMSVTFGNLTAAEQRSLDDRALIWIAENAPGLSEEASGFSIAFAHMSQRNIKSMLTGTIVAMGLISLLLVFVFKSLRLGFISLIPNFLPAALGLGIWGYLHGRLGLAGSVMTAFAFGIIVDDTIHFLTRYIKARRNGSNRENAVRYSFNTTGHALLTTTIVLASGFIVFATSGFEVSSTLGQLLAVTVCFAFLADFLCLPPLLMALDRNEKKDKIA